MLLICKIEEDYLKQHNDAVDGDKIGDCCEVMLRVRDRSQLTILQLEMHVSMG